tara:strand:+ start:796 stop:984 length:189 start_codon:yes stop_codon:yes gene_type:complete
VDGILLAQHLNKMIDERRARISEMLLSGSIKDISEYKQLVGSIESLDYIRDEIREILDKTEE